MGIVAEVGKDVKKFKVGDRVVVPFTIACGSCFFCEMSFIPAATRRSATARKRKGQWAMRPRACLVSRT